MPLNIYKLSPYVSKKKEENAASKLWDEKIALLFSYILQLLPCHPLNFSRLVRKKKIFRLGVCVCLHWKRNAAQTPEASQSFCVETMRFSLVGDFVNVSEWKKGKAEIKQENLSVQI